MEKYNGWTNYATWRVNLEIFDGFDPREWWQGSFDSAYHLGQALKDHAEEILMINDDANSLTYSYALAFLSDVNWTEIAQHIIDAYSEEAA